MGLPTMRYGWTAGKIKAVVEWAFILSQLWSSIAQCWFSSLL